jgi:hypothetical protein
MTHPDPDVRERRRNRRRQRSPLSPARPLHLVPFVLAATSATAPIHAQTIDTLALRAHTFFLSSDLLGGRDTGSPGEHIAAAYIEAKLRLLGLRGLMGGGTFRQSVPLRSFHVDPATRLTLAGSEGTRHFASGESFVLGTGGPAAFRDFEGPAVFVGDAALAPAGGPDLAGQVIVVGGTLGAEAAALLPAWKLAGVAGVLQLVPDTARFALLAASRGAERLFVDAAVDDPIWQPSMPTVVAGPDLAVALLAGVSLPPAALRGEPFDPVPLGRRVTVSLRGSVRAVQAANVGAVLPGSDPALRDEYVLYTAHYDHLGSVPAADGGDSIYNGFSDNAAGVAMLLAIARALSADPPARSVAFLFLTGEERGLLGSSFFAASPPLPLGHISALVNLDAGAPPVPPVSWRVAGGSDSPLGVLAAGVAARRGWTAQLSPASPNSDYWPFLRRGVPAIFLIPGTEWEATTPQQRDALRLRWDRYHHPDDEWAPDFPFAGLRRYATFALLVGRAVADAPRRPSSRPIHQPFTPARMRPWP